MRIFLIFLCSLCFAEEDVKPNYVYSAVCLRVIDGDTIEAEIDYGFKQKGIWKIRLLRIDCPEIREKGGEEARNYVFKKIEGKEIIVKSQKPDSFGRYLGEIYYYQDKIQINLNQELLDKKLAKER